MIAGLKPYAAYRDSGYPLIGHVPSHWNVVPLSRVARQKTELGGTQRQLLSVYLNRGVVRFEDVDEKRTNATSDDLSLYQSVSPGDLVLNNQQAWRGSVGVSRHSGIVSPAYYVLRVSPALLPEYANLLFRDRCMVSQYVVCSKGIGTIQRNLYWPHLKQIGVLVPPPYEQAAIVSFLDWASGRLERAIRAKRKVIALLNEQKSELIYRAVTRGTEPEAMLAPSGYEWVGETPKHWQLLRVCRLFRQVARYRIEGNEPKMSMSRHYGLVRSDKLSNRAAQSATSIKYSVCVPGDLVVNKYQAHNGLFGAATERGLITSNYSVFEPIGSISTEYFAYLFASLPYRTEFRMRCQGVGDGMMPLYSSAFLKVPAVVPPLEEQLRIVDFISRSTQGIATAIAKLQREIDLLGEYRNRLIAEVISGTLDVREAARSIPQHSEPEAAGDAADLDVNEELTEEG